MHRSYLPYLLIIPTLLLQICLVAFPLVFSFYCSFTSFKLLNPGSFGNFVGVNNYLEVFTSVDFWGVLSNTIIFLLVSVNVELVVGLALALLLAKKVIFGRRFATTLMLLPFMVPPILVGFQFRWFFNAQYGLVNNILFSLDFIKFPIGWLSEVNLAKITVVISELWQNIPFMAIILLAGRLALPKEPYEAASVDGASGFQMLRYITLPLLKPFIFLALAIKTLTAARAFDMVQIMTGGGPGGSTELIWTYTYRVGIAGFDFSYASAVSLIGVILSVGFAIYFFRQVEIL